VSTLHFGVLGPLDVRRGGQPQQLRGSRERALLGMLLSRRSRVVSVPALVEGVWGAAPPATAEKTLQSYVSRLRGLLEPDREQGGPSILDRAGSGYCLRAEPEAVDAALFELLAGKGARALAAGAPELALARLRRALALWRGEAYEDLPDAAFAAAERSRLSELRLAATGDRVDAELALGDAASLVGELQRLVAEHPLQERFWGQLIVAYYHAGRQADAVGVYRTVRARLVEEFGIEPGPQLRALEAAVLAQPPRLPTPGAARPQELPGVLAADRTRLVGRGREMEWLELAWQQALEDRGVLAVVEAAPGMGATRLAAELARRVADRGGTVVLGAKDAEALIGTGTDRPVLVVLDSPEDAGPSEDAGPGTDAGLGEGTGLGEAARLARRAERLPVLVLALTSLGAGTVAAVDEERVLRLGPLGAEQVAAIVAGYVGEEDLAAVEAVFASSGGVPARVHDDSAAWATARASERVGETAARLVSGRRDLAATEQTMAADVLGLRQVRARRAAALPAGSAAAGARPVVCPYKGLARFDEHDAPYFFGRDRLVAQLVTRCVEAPLLAVVGPSGSGKSSVVRAGLVPALRAGVLPGSEAWRVRVLRAGTLDAALFDAALFGPDPFAPDSSGVDLLVLDQFEEAFTAWPQQRRRQMLDHLAGAVERGDGRVRVVATVRADYYGRLTDHPALARLAGDNTVLVGPMSEGELRQAVEEPARVAGLDIEDGFADAVLADARQEPGVLPLLSTALLATWERRDGRTLRVAAYSAAGGVAGALTRLADGVYGGLDEAGRAAARRVFLRLAAPGEGGEDLRRRVSRSELAGTEPEEAVLTVLIGQRLVIADGDTLEVAHEALLREWPRLQAWLEVHRHLAEAASAWDAAGRAPGDLYRGARLQAAQDWANAHPGDARQLEQAFLTASAAAQERTLRDARRTARRLRSLASVLAALLVVALVSTALAVVQRSTSARQAQLARDASRSAQAGRLATVAGSLGADQIDLALLLGVEGYRLAPSVETHGGLQAALAHTPPNLDQVIRFGAPNVLPVVLPTSVSRDKRLVAAPQRDGTVGLWDLHSGRVLRTLRGSFGRQFAVFSGDAALLAVGGYDGTIGVWDVATGEPVGAPIRAGHGATYGQFDPTDPTRLFAVDDSGQVVRWDRSNPDAPKQIGPPLRYRMAPGDVMLVVINEAGSRLAAGSPRGTSTRVWNAHSGKRLRDLPGSPGFFAPDGVTLPTALGNRVDLWDVDTGQQRRAPLTGFTATVPGMLVSDDGRRIAVDDARVIKVFEVRSGRKIAALPLQELATTPAAFLPDGRLVTSGVAEVGIWRLDTARTQLGRTVRGHRGRVVGTFVPGTAEIATQGIDDGQILLWDVATGRPKGRLLGGAVTAPVAFSPEGARLAALGRDGTPRLWDRASGAELAVLPGAGPRRGGRPHAAAWSPAGQRVAVASGGTVLLWDVADPRQPHIVAQLATRGSPHPGVPDTLHLTFSHDGRWLAVQDTPEHTVTLFDSATGHKVWSQQLEPPGQTAMAFSPDGTTLAVSHGSSVAGVVEFRSVQTGAVQRILRTPSSGGVEFLHGGSVVMTTSDNGGPTLPERSIVQLWDAAALAPIGEPLPEPYGAYSLSRSPDGSTAVAGTADGAATIWEVSPERWAATACRIAGRNLTQSEWLRYLPGEPYRRTCPQWPDG